MRSKMTKEQVYKIYLLIFLALFSFALLIAFKVPGFKEWLYSMGLPGRLVLFGIAHFLIFISLAKIKSKIALFLCLALILFVDFLYLGNEFGWN
jgi:hypothetical protein